MLHATQYSTEREYEYAIHACVQKTQCVGNTSKCRTLYGFQKVRQHALEHTVVNQVTYCDWLMLHHQHVSNKRPAIMKHGDSLLCTTTL